MLCLENCQFLHLWHGPPFGDQIIIITTTIIEFWNIPQTTRAAT